MKKRRKEIWHILAGLILFAGLHVTAAGQRSDGGPEAPADSAVGPEAAAAMSDSVRVRELMSQIEDMKSNEMLLRVELDRVYNAGLTADSVKRAEQRRRIDSLRAVTCATPVVVEGDTLFGLYARQGGLTPENRAENTRQMILKVGKELIFNDDTLHLAEGLQQTDIMYGDRVIVSITDQDALWEGESRRELAERYYAVVSMKIEALQETYGILQMLKRGGLFLLVIALQAGLFWLTGYLFGKLRGKILLLTENKLKPFVIRDYEVLNTHRQGAILIFFSRILKWIVILVQLIFSIPMLFAIFPQTESIAKKLFLYIFEPVKMIFFSIIDYIPNLFIIAVIYLCIRYLVKGVRYIACEIENEKLKISGFYPDWAQPTFNIIRFLLYAFMIAMIYQYLPGSQLDIFKGISVFVGLIISLGSSTVIGNILAGFVITYMRPFKLGDRIRLNETEGNVIEKTPFVTRLRTPKNEIVTIPNSFIMSSHTTNYSVSARTYGLIIHTSVGFGYEVHWQQVHQLLVKAALDTPGVIPHPAPFVLDVDLKDSYPVYQINAYVKEVDSLPKIYSDLNQRIQDIFQNAGLELVLPHYYAQRDGNPVAMSPEYMKGDKSKRE
jgi:small-conductance mechanosensitive channel